MDIAVASETWMRDKPQLRRRNPLVGYISNSTTFQVRELRDRLVLRLSRSAWVLVAGAAALLGPLTTLALWMNPQRWSRMPLPMQWVLGAAIAAAWIWFLRSLLTRPRVEIFHHSGEIHYFLRGRSPQRIFRPADIAGVFIDSDVHISSSETRSVNHVLSVLTAGNEAIRLCASPHSELITPLAEQVAALTGSKLIEKSTGQVTE